MQPWLLTDMASGDRRFRTEPDPFPCSVDRKAPANVFKNDGSFLEMFKKAQQSSGSVPGTSAQASVPASVSPPVDAGDKQQVDANKPVKDIPKPKYGFVGKRRGGKILPTGKVKKAKQDEDEDTGKKDAWSQYMSEVKKYKDQSCQEEGATRPLVK